MGANISQLTIEYLSSKYMRIISVWKRYSDPRALDIWGAHILTIKYLKYLYLRIFLIIWGELVLETNSNKQEYHDLDLSRYIWGSNIQLWNIWGKISKSKYLRTKGVWKSDSDPRAAAAVNWDRSAPTPPPSCLDEKTLILVLNNFGWSKH